jgi:DNA polymerase III subunit delta'
VSFSEIIGQDRAICDLTRALEQRRLPHALLFAGPAGVGKGLAAIELAKSVLCAKAKLLACGRCPSCHRVDALTHADLNIVTVPEGKSEIPVEGIRALSARLAESPLEGTRKVAIIDPADRMSPEGQNGFLKTLEEPPADTTIILVAENTDALLPTVRSRCRRITFVPLAQDAVEAFLKERGAAAPTAATLAMLAQGSPGEAIRLMDGTFAEDRGGVVRAILAAGPGSEQEIAELIASGGSSKGKRALKERRSDAVAMLSALHSVIVDALRVKSGAPVRANADLAHAIKAFAGEEDVETIAALEKEVNDAIIVLAAYADIRLVALRLASAFTQRAAGLKES